MECLLLLFVLFGGMAVINAVMTPRSERGWWRQQPSQPSGPSGPSEPLSSRHFCHPDDEWYYASFPDTDSERSDST